MDPAPDHQIELRVLLEGLPDAAVGAGRDGLIVFVNALAETQFGYRREELIGRPIETLWPPNVRARYRRNLELYWELEHPLRFSDRALRPPQGRQRLHRRDELGDRGDRQGPAAAGDRARRLRAPGDRVAAAPPVPAAGRRRGARRARAARRRPERAERGGRGARALRRSGWSGWRCSTGRRRSPPGARSRPPSAASACRSTPATRSMARSWRRPRASTRSATRRACSCRRSPTCSRSRSRACTSRTASATRRSTTR